MIINRFTIVNTDLNTHIIDMIFQVKQNITVVTANPFTLF